MKRPVENYLENASIHILKYDLLKELPDGIGDRFPTSINYSEDDVEPIADAIFEKMISERKGLGKSPEENIVWTIYLKGRVPYWMAGQLTGIFILSDDVNGFKILNPNSGTSFWMFPRK